MDLIGKSPVPVTVLVLGKTAFLGCSFFVLVKTFALDALLIDTPLTSAVGTALYIAGCLTVVVSLIGLGRSTAVGFPERETELKTGGLYRFTRNPIYLGGFMICVGSCLYATHVVNLVLCALAVAVHTRIVRREEQFLERRFGEQWLAYKRRVPRYLGRIRRSDPDSTKM
jgi:protein-S-isoprenylcysteine O-methyltransferase Ste14